ncbi:MAG: hypothetical protein JXA25_13430 [Anaerolineales bacterium]|nr:hypothetical protein [Anaerolineales bacterium]
MTRIEVDPNELSNFGSMLYGKRGEIESIQRSVESALNISWSGASQAGVISRWQDTRSGLHKLVQETGDLSSFVKTKAQSFHDADKHSSSGIGAIASNWMAGAAVVGVTGVVLAEKGMQAWGKLGLREQVELGHDLREAYEIYETVKVVRSGKLIKDGVHSGHSIILGGHKVHQTVGVAKNLHHINNINIPAHMAKEAAGSTAIFTAVFAGGLNAYENWHTYQDEGLEKVVGATVVDTALDVALTAGGAFVGATAGGALGGALGALLGPPGAAAGAVIGGKVGAVAGGWVGGQLSELIKDQSWWEHAREGAAEVVRFQEQVTVAAVATSYRVGQQLGEATSRVGAGLMNTLQSAGGDFGRRLFGGGQPVSA